MSEEKKVTSIKLRKDQLEHAKKKDINVSQWARKRFDEDFINVKHLRKKLKELQEETILTELRLKDEEKRLEKEGGKIILQTIESVKKFLKQGIHLKDIIKYINNNAEVYNNLYYQDKNKLINYVKKECGLNE